MVRMDRQVNPAGLPNQLVERDEQTRVQPPSDFLSAPVRRAYKVSRQALTMVRTNSTTDPGIELGRPEARSNDDRAAEYISASFKTICECSQIFDLGRVRIIRQSPPKCCFASGKLSQREVFSKLHWLPFR